MLVMKAIVYMVGGEDRARCVYLWINEQILTINPFIFCN